MSAAASNKYHVVFISGASTGIGLETALLLAREGFRVYGGVRNEADGERLRKASGGGVIPVQLEVTDVQEIRAAIQTVSDDLGEATAFSLVNNAGIVVPGPVEFLSLEDWRRQFEVNLFGVVQLTQCALPLMRQVGRGRVVMVSSVAGRASMPFAGAYSASKFALESLSDSLRMELLPSGLKVILVEPGVIKTPIWQKSLKLAEGMDEAFPVQARAYYGEAYKTLLAITTGNDRTGLAPETVARVIHRALTAKAPKNRMVIGRDARIRLLAECYPSEWLDRIILSVLRHR